jgi:hypothetical protein
VGRWSGIYHVSPDFPVPKTLQHRVDGLVAGQLASSCSSYLANYLSVANPEVWRIHNLTLNVSVDAEFSDPLQVARNWGCAFASEVLSVLDSGESDSVVRFSNHAAFLAQFLSDLAAGRAWGKWYYEEFSDLRILSERQAICAIFLRHDPSAVELLLQLASIGRLESILQSISDSDACIIFDLCFESAPTGFRKDALQKWIGIVLELWNMAPLRAGSRQENRFRDALRLLARTLSQFPAGRSDMQLRAVIDGLLDVRRVLSEICFPAAIDSLIKNLADNDLPSAVALATRDGVYDPVPALSFFAERMQGDAAWGIQAAAVTLGESHQERFLTSKTTSEGESFLSMFGAVFLLGPSLNALQLDKLTHIAAQPTESPEKNAAVLRHLTAIKCLGRSRFSDTADDPALRLFSGFVGVSFRQALEKGDFSHLDLDGARRVLLQNLLGRGESHLPILYAELVSFPTDNLTFILRDLTHDEWFDVTPLSPSGTDISAVVQSSLQRISDLSKLNRPDLFLSDSLFSLIHDSPTPGDFSRGARLLRINDSTREQLGKLLGLNHSQLAFRLGSAQQHYPYFPLSDDWAGLMLDPFLDCTFTLLSHAALRHFSHRLFGFESSSPEHLYQNFLSGVSETCCRDEHLEVRLPSSPLSVVLHMAGLQKQKYRSSWLKGLEVWLLPPQE